MKEDHSSRGRHSDLLPPPTGPPSLATTLSAGNRAQEQQQKAVKKEGDTTSRNAVPWRPPEHLWPDVVLLSSFAFTSSFGPECQFGATGPIRRTSRSVPPSDTPTPPSDLPPNLYLSQKPFATPSPRICISLRNPSPHPKTSLPSPL
ncbi:hypothetical protein Pmani_035201 [Petrolisthes manimaculis]|uniref:Uncharacterized protein n=1 Tax=Petrolisthes manimaculis TaxID=1843537 RepID=A0AAE1NMV7_9EUCA|nr:hypothetical protein Pmani_035201 [Petrolisthes manimaculis]